MISRKVLIIGSSGVGKTAVFHRIINDTFSTSQRAAIGLKVDKKELELEEGSVSLILWDIAGGVPPEKVPKTYFLGASAVVYLFDLSRPETAEGMEKDLAWIKKTLPDCLTIIVGNKKDLVSADELRALQRQIVPDFFISAKTGEQVATVFQTVAVSLLKTRLK